MRAPRLQSMSGMSAAAHADRPMLVVAHPDDETIFFAPTLTSLVGLQQEVFVLCFSTGEAFFAQAGLHCQLPGQSPLATEHSCPFSYHDHYPMDLYPAWGR